MLDRAARAGLFHFIFQLGVPVRASVPGLSRLGTPKARPRPAQVNHCTAIESMWTKLRKYYDKTDKPFAYVDAILLHCKVLS